MLWQYVCFLCLCVQSCPTLGNPTDCSPPGSSVRRISQQEYWSGLPFPSLEDLPDPGIKPVSSALAGRFFTTEPPGKSPKSALDFFFLISHPLLNLPVGTQGRLWRLFPIVKEMGDMKRLCVQEPHRALHGIKISLLTR